MLSLPFFLSFAVASVSAAGLTEASLEKHVNALDLSFSFNPVKEAYWTGYPHHRRTPFALSPDGTRAYLAYLDQSETDVHVQQVDPATFAAVGTAVTVAGAKEAGGLVAHNDGFALLTNEALPSGTTNAPPSSTPVPVLYRYTAGKQTFKTFLGGPGVHPDDGLSASPDLNGDLVYSETAGLYGAYFVVTDYSGWAEGHFGDSVQYVSENGTLETLPESSSWGCSHNTGIAFEAADEVPFASICAEDQGAIWLNTETRGMDNTGVKISNENVTNGASNEPMGGMSGSYSGLARFIGEKSYIFAWVSRGAIDLTENTWMGAGYTHANNRTNNRNVAVAVMSDKQTLVGPQAISTVDAADGDAQVNWVTKGAADCSNAHAATFDGSSALITWEEIASPECDFVAMGCKGTFTGSKFQLVNSAGDKVGTPLSSMDTYVAGDMVTFPDGRICWPYVNMTWSLSQAVGYGSPTTSTKQMSFACMSNGNTTTAAAASSAIAATSAVPASSVKATSAAVAASANKPATSSVALVSSVKAQTAVAQTTTLSQAVPKPASNIHTASSVAAAHTSASHTRSRVTSKVTATTLATVTRAAPATTATTASTATAAASSSSDSQSIQDLWAQILAYLDQLQGMAQ